MADRDFFEFMGSALDCLRAEVPVAYVEMGRRLGSRRLRLHVDGSVRVLRWADPRLLLEDPTQRRWDCELAVQRPTIEALLEGRMDLVDALLADWLQLRGAPAAVSDAYDALSMFLRGAIRSPSLPALLDDYLGHTEGI
jgi:hypothetical protein